MSQSPGKQSGFTLIELMVVMAIIAILATAGLSAYTGYIKKARDATRIADVAAINTTILGAMSTTGIPPQTSKEVYDLVKAMNNGQPLVDPMVTVAAGIVTSGKSVCILGGWSTKTCTYTYRQCDGGMGYAVGAVFESQSNIGLYATTGIPAFFPSGPTIGLYEQGSCKTSCGTGISGCVLASMIGIPIKLTGSLTPKDTIDASFPTS